ncbi:hypothetical protein HDU89_002883 [Geranomyces variabilis]|nr:hypothetical protein HDU89_002883 [Geranomyces variabilis]
MQSGAGRLLCSGRKTLGKCKLSTCNGKSRNTTSPFRQLSSCQACFLAIVLLFPLLHPLCAFPATVAAQGGLSLWQGPYGPDLLTIDPRRGPRDPVLHPLYTNYTLNHSFNFSAYGLSTGFVIDNLFSPPEIVQLLQSAQAATLGTPRTKLGEYVTDTRLRGDSGGEIWLPRDSSAVLFRRVLRAGWTVATSTGWGYSSTYLRSNARVSLYRAGGRFRPHYDGPYVSPARSPSWPGDSSKYTLLVYLNTVADGGGGATRFANVETWEKMDVAPVAGRGVVFDYHVLHAGLPVEAGAEKWVLKMDVMFQYRRAMVYNTLD